MANMKVEEVEGIGPSYGAKLGEAGIKDTDTLLKLCCDKKGRKETAEKSGISEGQLLKWANMCDLFRIKGVGPEYAELLEAAGVDTVKELRNRNAANLAEACAKVNEEKKLTRSVPSEKVVTGWIDQAKDLPPVITH
jgi:predicted flap endonuclease-1-like 5' DNA nuclease